MNSNDDSFESLEASLRRLKPVAFEGSVADVMFAAGEQSGWEKAQAQLQRKSGLLIAWQLATAASLMLACFSSLNWVRESPTPAVAHNQPAHDPANAELEEVSEKPDETQAVSKLRHSTRMMTLKPKTKSESAIGLRNAMLWDQIQPYAKSNRERQLERNDGVALRLSRGSSMVAKQIQNSLLETNDDF